MERREDWDHLERMIQKVNQRRGARNLSREDLECFGPLYRRVSSDLAYVRLNNMNEDLSLHLNRLVGQAHALLYESESSSHPFQSLLKFYVHDFPMLLQKRKGYFLAAFVLSLIGAGYAYWLVSVHPARLDLFIPKELQSSVKIWKSGKISAKPYAAFSGYLMVHNFQIGLLAFAAGTVFGLPTIYLLFVNGATIGSLSAVINQVHRQGAFWPGILPHGVAELTAIFICGAAGLMMGIGLLFPGDYRRIESFRNAGREAVQLVMGTIPLFIFAGIVEGMFSHLDISPVVRIGFALLNGIFWYLYLFLPRQYIEVKKPTGTTIPTHP